MHQAKCAEKYDIQKLHFFRESCGFEDLKKNIEETRIFTVC